MLVHPPRRSRALVTLLAAFSVGLGLPALSLAGSAAADDDGAGRQPVAPLFDRLEDYRQPRASRIEGAPVRVRPTDYTAYSVDVAALADRLGAAGAASPARVSVPDPDGDTVTLAVVEDSVMEAGLQARHPDIRTYAGKVVGDPTSSVRLSVSPLGFHASVQGSEDSWLVDPAVDAPGTTTHLTYDRSALPSAPAAEGLAEDLLPKAAPGRATGLRAAERTPADGIVKRRTYRLALVNDPAYARYFGIGGAPASAATVLAQKAVLINRVNQVYNDDLAIRLVLVDGTEKLNLATPGEATGANGPCGASPCYDAAALAADGDGCTSALLDRNQFVIGQLIGADRYDVGHIMLGINGGGIAALGAVGTADKAAGCTGLDTPVGDVMAIDYVAHELGHQFAGNHTFNGTQGACAGGNRNAGTSVEPGSGSSVMGYAGICDADDLQPHTDPTFSQRSIDEITAHVTAAPEAFDEVQTISMTGFDQADSLTFNYPGVDPISVGTGPEEFNALTIADTVRRLTGFTPLVLGYDDPLPLNPILGDPSQGFTLSFGLVDGAGVDVQRITVTSDSTGFSASTGVQVNGGPGTNQGGLAQDTGNHAPTVTAPADKTIPLRTPFALTGSATDSDGDALTYTWEQNDAGGTNGQQLTSGSTASGPLFRVFGTAADVSEEESLTIGSPDLNLPGSDPTRSFPDLAQVLADRTNAATGSCPPAGADPVAPTVVECYSELLPTVARTLNFRLTARDGFPTGGGTQFDDTVLTVGTAGPFRVTSQASQATVEGGAPGTVTWSVAGTNASEYAPNVRILMSTDGGVTWPNVIAASTPNDGTQEITWPRIDTERARIKIEAVGNYFYDVNRSEFAIESPIRLTVPPATTVDHSDPLLDAAGNPLTVEITGIDPSAFAQLDATVTGINGVTAVRRGNTGVFDLVGAVTDVPGQKTATITITGPGDLSVQQGFPVAITAEDLDVRYTGPSEAQIGTPLTLSAALAEPVDGSPGDPRGAVVTFVDRAGATLCTAETAGTLTAPTASCTFTPTGEARSITVGTVVTGRYADDDPASDSKLDLVLVLIDDVAPETTFLAEPDPIVLDPTFVVTAISSEPGSKFSCTLDGAAVSCPNGSFEVRRAAPGTHVIQVVATDKAGNKDRSPVRAVFTVPMGDTAFKILDGWKRVPATGTYTGTALVSGPRGALLSTRVKDADQLALIVTTGPRAGRITVDLGRNDLGSYNLKTDTEEQRVILQLPVGSKRAGNLEIRTLSKRQVRIEGVAVVTNP